MESFKTTTRQWVISLGLIIPIFITSFLYFNEAPKLRVPKVVATGLHHPSQNNPTANTSHSTHNERTLNPAPKPEAIKGDMFIYSRQFVNGDNVSINTGGGTLKDAGNETVSMVINNGTMIAEDVPAKDPSKDHVEHVVDPAVKDLSGYVSVVNAKHQLYVNCTKCAYVSSSGQLLGTKAGELIDSYPCIIRMNNAPTKGFEADVGSRTTVRVVAHSAIKGVYSRRSSLLKDPGQPRFFFLWGPEGQMKTNGKGASYNVATSLSKEFSKDGMQVFVFSQRQIAYADKVFEIETGKNRLSSGSWLSTGWFTMILSRGICEEITVFGMVTEDYCKINPDSKVPYHYYQAGGSKECSMYRNNEKAKKNGHRFMTEKSVFARWSKQWPWISFRYPDWSATK